MTNTNPSDLDREALSRDIMDAIRQLEDEIYTEGYQAECGDGNVKQTTKAREAREALKEAIRKALPRVSSNMDGEALKKAIATFYGCDGKFTECLEAAIKAGVAALPRASGVPEAERRPDAYQQLKDGKWVECSEFVARGWGDKLDEGTRALYASPPPVGATSGEADYLNSIARKLRTYASIYTGDKEARKMADWCERMASSPIASEPKDAGSGERTELNLGAQERAILSATSTFLGGSLAIVALENLHAAGFSITRTAPSGAKP